MNQRLSKIKRVAARGLASASLLAAASVIQAQSGPPRLAAVGRMGLPDAVHRARLTGRLAPSTRLPISISLEPTDAEGLEAYANRVSDPSSPDYRRFLSPTEVGARYGASEAKVRAVMAYLRSQGMTVTLVSENRLSVLAEGTAATAERAFDTRFGTYRAIPLAPTDRAEFFSYTEEPKLPSSLAPDIVHIGGLENSTGPAFRSLTAAEARSVYRAAPLFDGGFRGEGRTVGISNFDGFRLTNVPLYCARYGLPTPAGGVGSNVKTVTVGFGSGAGTPQGEGDLDIQMVLGIAPLCNLVVYDGGTDLVSVLTREANDNSADIITESYGWSLSSSAATAAHGAYPFFYKGTLSNQYYGTSFASPMLALAEQKLNTLGYFGAGAKRFGRLQDLIYAQNGRSDVWTSCRGATASCRTARQVQRPPGGTP